MFVFLKRKGVRNEEEMVLPNGIVGGGGGRGV